MWQCGGSTLDEKQGLHGGCIHVTFICSLRSMCNGMKRGLEGNQAASDHPWDFLDDKLVGNLPTGLPALMKSRETFVGN